MNGKDYDESLVRNSENEEKYEMLSKSLVDVMNYYIKLNFDQMSKYEKKAKQYEIVNNILQTLTIVCTVATTIFLAIPEITKIIPIVLKAYPKTTNLAKMS